MRDFDFKYPVVIIGFAIVLGFVINYISGMTWENNLADMTKTNKIVTYLILLLALFFWRNRAKFRKG